MIAIRIPRELLLRFVRVVGVAAGGVQAAQAARGELGPGDELLGVLGRVDLCGHHAAGPGLEILRDQRVVGRRHAHEAVEVVGPGAGRGQLHFLISQAAMLLVEPEAMKPAGQAEHVDRDRMQ